MGVEKERIQSALAASGKNGAFYAETYEPDSERLTVDLGKIIAPRSVLSDEVASTWRDSRNKRKPHLRERATWTFKLTLVFSQRVTVEQYERDVSDTPICLPRDKERGLTAVVLKIANVNYTHPPRQQSSSGSTVEIFFDAQLSPS